MLSPTDPVLAGDVQVGRPNEGGEHTVRLGAASWRPRSAVPLRDGARMSRGFDEIQLYGMLTVVSLRATKTRVVTGNWTKIPGFRVQRYGVMITQRRAQTGP